MLWTSLLEKHARLLVDYCIEAKPGWEVVISAGVEAVPLVYELVKALASRGAYPVTMLRDELLTEAFYKYASIEALEHEPRIDLRVMEEANALINIISPSHARPLVGVPADRVARTYKASARVHKVFLERSARGELRWVVTPYPTRALAQEAGMSFIDFVDFVFKALKLYEEDPVKAWRMQAEMQERIIEVLSKSDEIKIVGKGVDLFLKVGGRKWINDDGKYNMPGGEVFTAPIEDSVEGWIEFEYPSLYSGYEVEGVRLVFRRGVVVEAKAARGDDVLKSILATDEGAKRVGEFAFGLNYSIDRHTKIILFDEKRGGTLHLALGSAYPETGGRNVSSVHWDLIKDASRVEVYADGDLVYSNGRFTILES